MNQGYQVLVRNYDEDEESPIQYLATASTFEFPEFTWGRDRARAALSIAAGIAETQRTEIQVRNSEGFLVGVIVAVLEDDPHVGPCWSAMWNYVLKEHRGPIGSLMFREFVQLARDVGAPTIAYSHRVSEGVYQIKYRRVKSHG